MNFEQHPKLIDRIRSLSWRQVAAGAFAVIVAGYLLLTLARNWQELLQYEWRIKPLYLVTSFLAYLLSLLLGASAWHRIISSMDQRLPYSTGIKLFMQSHLAKRVPGLIWYALGRLYLYEREGVTKSAVSVALVFEVITMAIGGIIAYLATMWSGSKTIEALEQWWLVFPMAGLLFVMLWPRSLTGIANRLLVRRGHALLSSQPSRTDLVEWALLQAAAWLGGGMFIFLLAAGVYPDLDWADVILIINSWVGSGLVALAALIVPLGMGIKEVTLAYLLSSFIPWPAAVLISLLSRICSIIGDCIGLLLVSRL